MKQNEKKIRKILKKSFYTQKITIFLIIIIISLFCLSLPSPYLKAEEVKLATEMFGINDPFDTQDHDFSNPTDVAKMNEMIGWLRDELGIKLVSDSISSMKITDSGANYYQDVWNLIDLYVKNNDLEFFLIQSPKITNDNFCIAGDIDYINHKLLTADREANCVPKTSQTIERYRSYIEGLINKIVTKYPDRKDKIKYIMVFNEPNFDFLIGNCGKFNPECYWYMPVVEMQEILYNAVKINGLNTKVILGGPSSEGPLAIYDGILQNLQGRCGGTGCFDYMDYHAYFWPNKDTRKGYRSISVQINAEGDQAQRTYQTIRDLLNKYGFGDKPILIQQSGGTQGRLNSNSIFISEEEQASILFKHKIYQAAKGIGPTQWSTMIDLGCFKNTIHSIFAIMGLVFDGIPQPDQLNCLESGCDGQLPCPDPGWGKRKLSFFTYKKAMQMLKDINLSTIQTIKEDRNIFQYKVTKSDGKPLYFAWWDWFEAFGWKTEYQGTKSITLDVPLISTPKARITEAVANFDTGINITDFDNAFKTYEVPVTNNKITLKMGRKPIYIEEGL